MTYSRLPERFFNARGGLAHDQEQHAIYVTVGKSLYLIHQTVRDLSPEIFNDTHWCWNATRIASHSCSMLSTASRLVAARATLRELVDSIDGLTPEIVAIIGGSECSRVEWHWFTHPGSCHKFLVDFITRKD